MMFGLGTYIICSHICGRLYRWDVMMFGVVVAFFCASRWPAWPSCTAVDGEGVPLVHFV